MPSFAVTIYAASRRRFPEHHGQVARALGRAIATRGWILVYGGANIGLMGACADAALAAGGTVQGVILDTFSRVAHQGVASMEVVGNMRDRKARLAHRGDAFVVLPGAFGTLEELSEILVERQLDIHRKPLVFLDPSDYWAPLRAQFDRMVADGFLPEEYLSVFRIARDVDSAMTIIQTSTDAAG